MGATVKSNMTPVCQFCVYVWHNKYCRYCLCYSLSIFVNTNYSCHVLHQCTYNQFQFPRGASAVANENCLAGNGKLTPLKSVASLFVS